MYDFLLCLMELLSEFISIFDRKKYEIMQSLHLCVMPDIFLNFSYSTEGQITTVLREL